jgi:hypothetical protein
MGGNFGALLTHFKGAVFATSEDSMRAKWELVMQVSAVTLLDFPGVDLRTLTRSTTTFGHTPRLTLHNLYSHAGSVQLPLVALGSKGPCP